MRKYLTEINVEDPDISILLNDGIITLDELHLFTTEKDLDDLNISRKSKRIILKERLKYRKENK